jgi:hypothetical protein
VLHEGLEAIVASDREVAPGGEVTPGLRGNRGGPRLPVGGSRWRMGRPGKEENWPSPKKDSNIFYLFENFQKT